MNDEVESRNLVSFLKEFIEMTFNLEANSIYAFKRNGIVLDEWKKQNKTKPVAKYLKSCVTAELILLAFPNLRWNLHLAMCIIYLLIMLYSHMQYHNDTTIKTQEVFFIKICTSHFIVRVRKGYSRFYCERELETEHNCNILTPTLMAVSVVSFSFSRAAQPEAHSAGWWLSLLHLISNFSGPPLIGAPRAPSAWCRFPYHISSITVTPTVTIWLLSWLSYIIVQRPLNRLLDLWNGIFDCHQAEITVMQFRGHSLLEYQSMSVSRDFSTLSLFIS